MRRTKKIVETKGRPGRPKGSKNTKPRSDKGKRRKKTLRTAPQRKVTKESAFEVYRARVTGYTAAQTAKMFGISLPTVASYVDEMRKELLISRDGDMLQDELNHAKLRINELYSLRTLISCVLKQQEQILRHAVPSIDSSNKEEIAFFIDLQNRALMVAKTYSNLFFSANKEIREESRYISDLAGLVQKKDEDDDNLIADKTDFAEFLGGLQSIFSDPVQIRKTVIGMLEAGEQKKQLEQVEEEIIDVDIKENIGNEEDESTVIDVERIS